MRKIVFAVMLAIVALSPVRAEDCRLVRIASLDMLPSAGNRVVVPAAIGDKPLRLIVDTGGYMTAFTEEKVQELGLPVEIIPESGVVKFGGTPLRRAVTLSDFRIGRLKAPRLRYLLWPPGSLGPDVDGLLAPDLIANFDLDFDFAGGKFNLISRDHCEGKVGYWTNQPLIGIPIVRDDDNVHIWVHVLLDGKDIKALIDTGAPHSVMSLETAQSRYDISDNDPKLVSVPNGPNRTTGAKRYPFEKISFGSIEVQHPMITLVPDREAGMGPRGPQLILGLSILRQLHVYIAYGEKMMYVTPASEHK